MKQTLGLESATESSGRLTRAELDREVAAARGTFVQPDQLLNGMAVCKLIYRDGVAVDWLHLYTNLAWETQSGRPSAVGQYASDLAPGIWELDAEVRQILTRVGEGGSPERFTRFLRSMGQWFDVQAYCPKPGYFVAVFDVVTERVEREQAFQQSQQRLALAQSASKSGIWDWDIPGGNLVWTPELFALFGLDPQHSVASFDLWRSVLHPADLECAEARVNEAVSTRRQLFNEYRIVVGGKVRWIRAYGHTLYDEAGAPQRMLGLCVDVTEMKEMSQQAADAVAANVAKSTFLATMSHELRTPLNSIIGFTSLLLDGLSGELNEEQARQMTIVRRSGQQLLDLISEVLDIAKVESGKLTMELVPVQLRSLLLAEQEVLRPIAEERGLTLESPECEEGILVRADFKRLSQVIRNLLSNAAKYTDVGQIRARASKQGSSVRIEIQDSGIGIAENEITRIFAPFRRSADPRSAARVGTGLGLSISRSLVLAMGGDIGVHSVPGEGSTFTVTLPLA